MKAYHKGVFIKVATWLMAEVVLNLVGLDNLADYSEFVFDNHFDSMSAHLEVVATLTLAHSNAPSVHA